MALILYPSGVIDAYKADDLTFTDDEILDLFNSYEVIRTKRLFDIPNCWMVWGENKNPPEDTFSHIGSSITEQKIYSPILFIHDTEIDPAWMLTDNPILYPYNRFQSDLQQFIDDVARDILEYRKTSGQDENLVILTTLGPTNDKRVLFDFDPNKQSQEFWKIHFSDFAEKVTKFLLNNQEKTFRNKGVIIFEDRKIVIRISHEHFADFLNDLVKIAEINEKFEWCSFLKDFKEPWQTHVENVKE